MSIVFRPQTPPVSHTDPPPPPARTALRTLVVPALLGGGALTAGSIAFFGYLITRDDAFALFGFDLLPFGAAAVILGLWLLGSDDELRGRPARRAVFWLLLANIPAAMVYTVVGMALVLASADLATID